MYPVEYNDKDDTLFFECPYCKMYIIVYKNEINCKIFRCGYYKHNYVQIDPHLPKIECDKLVHQNSIFGCAKPFKLCTSDNILYTVEKCEYI